MEYFQNVYRLFKPIGHISIVSFDIAVIFYYYRVGEDACFSQLRLWIYGQFILHVWLGIISFYNLLERTDPFRQVYLGNRLSVVLKFGWTLYALFLMYNAQTCMTLAPLVYWSVGAGALILSISLAIEGKTRPMLSPGSRTEPISVPIVLPEIPFTHEKLESCPICIEPFKQDEPVSMLSCDHLYHPACIYEWLKNNLHCPLCRTPVEPGPPIGPPGPNSLATLGLVV